jgi:hypothetical protein
LGPRSRSGLPRSHNARTIAALASNPGCARRAIMDAAGVDKQRIAAYAGFPAPFGQSRFALVEAPARRNSGANPLSRLAPKGNGATAEAAEIFVQAPQARTAVPLQWSRYYGLQRVQGSRFLQWHTT